MDNLNPPNILFIIKNNGQFFLRAGMHTSVRGVQISSEPDSSYFLRVDWSGRGLGSGFRLLLTDGQDAWRAEGKNPTSHDLTACHTFVMLDVTDLCPDKLTCVTTHTHFSHLGTFQSVLLLTLMAAGFRGRFISSSQARIQQAAGNRTVDVQTI